VTEHIADASGDLVTLTATLVARNFRRERPSKAVLRRRLKSPDRKTRMDAYRFLHYRKVHGLR